MAGMPVAKRARVCALDAFVSTLEVPGLDKPYGIIVLVDGTRLVSTAQHTLQLLTPAGQLFSIAGDEDKDAGFESGKGANARFNCPTSMTVDAAGRIVVVDSGNHALRRVSKSGEVTKLAGNGEPGFADGQGDAARFICPDGVALAANDEIVVADTYNHAIRVVTPGGAVRTLAGNGEAGFADGQGAAARFNNPKGLARDTDGSILVADSENHAVRRVTMEGAVSTVAGNGEAGYADGEGAAARFNGPRDVVVDKEGTMLVADMHNQRLRKIVGRQVTTLAGGSEAGTADGAGAGARFHEPFRMALDERGRLLVAECGRAGMLRVVDASLAPPAWMGPVDGAAEALAKKAQQMVQLVGDYGKLVEDGELADGVFVVEGERFPMHRSVLAARSEYFRARFKSGMQDGGSKEVCYEDVSASAFRVLLRFLYAGELPAWEVGRGGQDAGSGGGGSGAGGRRDAGAGSSSKVCSGGKGEVKGKAEDNQEEEARESLVQELLRVADRFQAGGLYEHCLAEFGRTLTVETAIQQLVWAHARAPEGARAVAMEYVVTNCRAIQVGYTSDVRMFSGVPGACTSRVSHHVCRFARVSRCFARACTSRVWLCALRCSLGVAHPALVYWEHGRTRKKITGVEQQSEAALRGPALPARGARAKVFCG
jgi:sugar lactone lactonase YvrE